MIAVKCNSHRARLKLEATLGSRCGPVYYSFTRETGKGVYLLSEEDAAIAKGITGVVAFRYGDDLSETWPRRDRTKS